MDDRFVERDEDGYEWVFTQKIQRFGTDENKSCWDCKYLITRGMASRKCMIREHRDKNIHAPQSGEEEKKEYGDTVANGCPSYTLSQDLLGVPVEHGVNCDCDDSCLEYFCPCGWSISTNRKETHCPMCGKALK